MSRTFQFRLWHLFLVVGLACIPASLASFLDWSAESWLQNSFALAFASCATVILAGCIYALAEGLIRRCSRELPEEVNVPEKVDRQKASTSRSRYAKLPNRQQSGFKW